MTNFANAKRPAWLTYIVSAAGILILFIVGIQLGGALSAGGQPVSAGAANVESKAPGGALVEKPFEVKDFTLTNQAGKAMSLKDLRGHTVVLFFGYTHCPDVCPTTLADYTRVKQQLGADADKVAFMFISIDAERDKPEVVRDFLGRFDAGFVGLTGEDAALTQIASQFGAYYKIPDHHHAAGTDHTEKVNSANYFVEHTSPSFIIDSKGYLRMVYFYGAKAEDLTTGIHNLLKS